ncbi:MAG: helix-turn-helix domain-containing protein, partial [Acidimicrobiia bacterium]|nr:helix-turn-helix domain-containing protein [Acidimicrobiia bacterium]
MAPQSPVVARRELASRLRAYRIELEIEPKAIASQLGFSRNYWSAVENSRSVLAANRLDQVIEMFGIDDVAAEELRSLWSFAKQRGWWTEYSDVIAEVVLELFGLEYGA